MKICCAISMNRKYLGFLKCDKNGEQSIGVNEREITNIKENGVLG